MSQFFTDNLTEEMIDRRIAELDMERLINIAITYNNLPTTQPFNRIDLSLPRLEMIISLWQRDIQIPQDLTYLLYRQDALASCLYKGIPSDS
jgi:hypothetical protein